MDESNSFMDQSSYADPNEPVLRVILHTQQNKQFLEYVNGRQKAFEKAAELLRWKSDGLKVLLEKFEQSVYNGTPLGQIKRTTHNLIDNGSLEVVELLQIPFDRPDSKEETGTATHLPPNQPTLLEDSYYEPPENEIEGYVDEYVQNCNDADEWEPVVVVQRTKKVVFKDCIMPSKSKKFTGNAEVRTSDQASNLVVQDTKIKPLGAPQLSDQEPPQHVVQQILDYASNQENLTSEEPAATHFPPDRPTLLEDSYYEPPENEVEGYVDDYVQNCNDADEWEPVAVVQRTKKAVFNDGPKQSNKFAGVKNSEHASKLTMQMDVETEPLLATQLPYREPPLHDVKQILDYASDQEDSTNDESANKHNTMLTMDSEKCLSEQTDHVNLDVNRDVHEQSFEQKEHVSGVTEAEILQYSSGQDVTGGSESVDLMNNTFAPEVVQYQDQTIGMECETVGEEQNVTEDGVQTETTSESTNYDDLLTCSIKEFYKKIPWMYYIVSEVKARRRWKSMSDLDEFKKKKEKEAEQKAKVEEDARIAEEQRVLIAQRIEAREKDRNYMYMILKIDLMFEAPIITVKGAPPLPPALTEFTEYLLRQHKGGGGGLSVDVNQYLYKQVRSNQNSSDPELFTFYKRLLELKLMDVNTAGINRFVKFMSNKWKTGKVLKAKEKAFIEGLSEWIESAWKMARTKYLARRKKGVSPKWVQEAVQTQNIDTNYPKYYDTDFFKSRMQFHMLNEKNDPESDVIALHYNILAKERIEDEILDQDFHLLGKECAALKDVPVALEKAFFFELLGLKGRT